MEIQTLNTACTELGAKRATLSGELDLLSRGSVAAAEAAQNAELEATSLAAEANRYVLLKVAAAILCEAIERYRKRKQGPILRRASEIFKRLTAGSFDGLQVELDDRDVPVVTGVRLGGASVTVDGMSNGTRDQLFLALRVVIIEHHVAAKGPMPFIADDLLVDFDDQRGAAALGILGELSEQTQVLVFTHHAHLPALAEKVLPKAGEDS